MSYRSSFDQLRYVDRTFFPMLSTGEFALLSLAQLGEFEAERIPGDHDAHVCAWYADRACVLTVAALTNFCPPPVENDVVPVVTTPAMSGQGVGSRVKCVNPSACDSAEDCLGGCNPAQMIPAMSGQGVGSLPSGLVLALENGPGLDVGVRAVTLHGVPHAAFSWLEESLPRFLFVLFSELLELGGFLGLLLPRLLLSGPSVAFGLLSGLLGLLRGLHLLVGPLHFVGGAFQRNFHAHRLYPLPGECCGQRTNKNANCDLQNVVHVGSPFSVSL